MGTWPIFVLFILQGCFVKLLGIRINLLFYRCIFLFLSFSLIYYFLGHFTFTYNNLIHTFQQYILHVWILFLLAPNQIMLKTITINSTIPQYITWICHTHVIILRFNVYVEIFFTHKRTIPLFASQQQISFNKRPPLQTWLCYWTIVLHYQYPHLKKF